MPRLEPDAHSCSHQRAQDGLIEDQRAELARLRKENTELAYRFLDPLRVTGRLRSFSDTRLPVILEMRRCHV